jgi:hypothetical protein
LQLPPETISPIEITSLYCDVSLGLTYDKVKEAINNYHNRQKLEQLRYEAREGVNSIIDNTERIGKTGLDKV